MTDADAAVEILRRAAEDRSAHQHLGARVDAARTLARFVLMRFYRNEVSL